MGERKLHFSDHAYIRYAERVGPDKFGTFEDSLIDKLPEGLTSSSSGGKISKFILFRGKVLKVIIAKASGTIITIYNMAEFATPKALKALISLLTNHHGEEPNG